MIYFKYVSFFCLFIALCGCAFSTGALNVDSSDPNIKFEYNGFELYPISLMVFPPIVRDSSREHAQCFYNDDRYISIVVPKGIYNDNISARIELESGVMLEGRIIAVQDKSKDVQVDIYFPISCEDVQGAALYIFGLDGDPIVAQTRYSRDYETMEHITMEEYDKMCKIMYSTQEACYNHYNWPKNIRAKNSDDAHKYLSESRKARGYDKQLGGWENTVRGAIGLLMLVGRVAPH